nr:hypothetical protein [Tanacetum cinerariifolium]
MGGSSSQPRTNPPRSPINAFSIEELYMPEFSESLQENIGYWEAPNTYEAAGEQVATSPTKSRKKATRNRQKRMIENDDAPQKTLWITKEEVALAKCWLAVYKTTRMDSGAEDEDYVQRAMIHYEIETEIPFKLRSGGSKRHKSSSSSSFNTESGEASINLNTNVDDNDEDEVQKVQRLEGRDKARAVGKKKGSKAPGSSTVNEDAMSRLM